MLALLMLCTFPSASSRDLSAIADSVDNIKLDEARQTEVSGLTIERGGAKFILESGTLTLSTPVLGKSIGAFFSGKGRFEIIPPNSAEKYMFRKLCSDTAAFWEFKELAMIATDGTIAEFENKFQFGPSRKTTPGTDPLAAFVDYTKGELEESFSASVLSDLLQNQLPGQFRARFKADCGNLFFIYDPEEVEEITLIKSSSTANGIIAELVSSFHSPEQYAESHWGPDHENKDVIDSLDYEISSKIWQSAKVDLEVKLSFIARVDGLQAVRFQLFPDLMKETIRVANAAGDSLFWLKLKEESGITVFLDKPLVKGERQLLKFQYSSKDMLAKTPWGNSILVSSTTWYPNYGYLKRCKFRTKFACPEQYTILSVGKKTSEKVEEGFRIAEFDISGYPVSMVSYNYGAFKRDTAVTQEGVPIEVYRSEDHGKASSGMIKNVLSDISASTSLFSAEIGKYPFERMMATEIPSSHGQGMPGFLHLAWKTFQEQTIPYDDAFRAHEVAHQWWGHLVGWQSYHDQWLSEGFAEYMGAHYVQKKYVNDEQNRGKFNELLDRWREDVFQSGSFEVWGGTSYVGAYREGNDAGPIWMGFRLASSESADYTTLVYSKGAYVLYMLRMMMFDFAKKDESKFNAMLGDFAQEFRWKEASTADFVRIAEKHYGSKLDWFFNQWIYDTQIPKYKWSIATTQEADGQYLVTIDITTEGVRDGFRMPVPLTVVMEGEYVTTTRLQIDTNPKRISLRLPYKPMKFVFNSYKSVLCKEQKL
jgi:hypothetical protein